MRTSMLCAVGPAGLLAACGGTSSTDGNASGGAAAPVASGAADVLDACAKLDKAVVGASLSATVQSAELSAVHDGTDGADRYSQCTYGFGGTRMVVFGSGQSSGGASEDVAHLTARVRQQMQEGADAPSEDVPGIGKGGLWNPELHMLYVFTGEGRFWSFTMGAMGEPDQKASAIALATLALTATAPAPTLWTLRGDGLSRTVGGEVQILRFGTAKKAALVALTAVMGKPQMTRTSPDCGQGEPMTMVDYRGGLALQFLKGKFSGWSLEAPANPGLKTAADITLGATLTALRKAYPDIDVDAGSLGVMFTREDGPSGFLDSMKPGARVIGLYAGETCMIS